MCKVLGASGSCEVCRVMKGLGLGVAQEHVLATICDCCRGLEMGPDKPRDNRDEHGTSTKALHLTRDFSRADPSTTKHS